MKSTPSTPKRRAYLSKTPARFAAAVGDIIDSATPRSSAALADLNITKSNVRSATASLTKACQTGLKEPSTKKQLIGIFRKHCQPTTNKSALARLIGTSRTSLNRKRSLGSKKINPETVDLVKSFYVDNDISIPFPNKTKSVQPLYVLKGTGPVTYAKFRAINVHVKISFSSFWNLRPKYVKKQNQARLLQCVCDVCENVKLMLNCITASMARQKLDIPVLFKKSTYSADYRIRSLGLSTLCSQKEYRPGCLMRKCAQCGTDKIKEALRCSG